MGEECWCGGEGDGRNGWTRQRLCEREAEGTRVRDRVSDMSRRCRSCVCVCGAEMRWNVFEMCKASLNKLEVRFGPRRSTGRTWMRGRGLSAVGTYSV